VVTHTHTHHDRNNSVTEHSKINVIVVLAEEILVFFPENYHKAKQVVNTED